MKSKRDFLQSLEQYGVDLAKMPKQENTALGASGNSTELSGTFKKLNVD